MLVTCVGRTGTNHRWRHLYVLFLVSDLKKEDDTFKVVHNAVILPELVTTSNYSCMCVTALYWPHW